MMLINLNHSGSQCHLATPGLMFLADQLKTLAAYKRAIYIV